MRRLFFYFLSCGLLAMSLCSCGDSPGKSAYVQQHSNIEESIANDLAIDENSGLHYILVSEYESKLSISIGLKEPILSSDFLAQIESINDVVSPIVLDSGLPFYQLHISLSNEEELLLTWNTSDFETGDYFNLSTREMKSGVSVNELKKEVGQEQTITYVQLNLVKVNKIVTSKPNSVGGVDVSVDVERRTGSNGTIKYIWLTFVPYNAVGDPQTSEIGAQSAVRGKITGPINDNQTHNYSWENAWYNSSITRAELVGIEIEYMDGTKIVAKR